MNTAVCLVLLMSAASAFVPHMNAKSRCSHMLLWGRPKKVDSQDFSDDLDPYEGFLDTNTEIEGSIADTLAREWSLQDGTDDTGTALAVKKSKLNKPRKQWEHWDAFMEEEFGDMDRALTKDEEWIYELRDAVELKRGMAIWSQRSEKEISAEKAKAQREKVIHVPPKFENIVTRVFLEKTSTMKQMRAENLLVAIEFRKWMLENRKRFKKNPVPVVKCEVARKWLLKHPAAALKARGVYRQPPEVVMDELRSPLVDVQFEMKKDTKVSSPSPPEGPAPTNAPMMGSKKAVSTKVTTNSIINWELPAAELPEQMTSRPIVPMSSGDGSPEFKIDEVDILVATEGDYFVVM